MEENIDPNAIEDEDLRHVVITLMNLVETLSGKVKEQAEEIQRLRDENQRLKGEQGKPKIKANKAAGNLSSEKERREERGHGRSKGSKQQHLHIDRVEELKLDRQDVPPDAVFKGYEEVMVQEVIFRPETILFRKEKYYSPGQQRTYQAQLPKGYHGQFGPQLRAWVLTLYYQGVMSEPKILDVLQTVGISISAGQLSDLLIKQQEGFHAESVAVVRAGLASSPWQHLDSTGTRVNGSNQHCHILCNPLYSFYCTTPNKDRLSMLRVLLAGTAPSFQGNTKALTVMEQIGVSAIWIAVLRYHFEQDQLDERVLTEEQVEAWLSRTVPKMGPTVRKSVKDAMAIAAYRTQTTYPIVSLLLCDDASQFNALTDELALCWIHEFRHYKKLLPRFTHHCALLETFGQQFWQLYHDLSDSRLHPNPIEARNIRARFDQLFTQQSGYQALDECKARTLRKREHLLLVLSHPEILLHNNPAELGARQRVRKRDVSLQARTHEGIEAWDTFQTLVATAKKLGVNLFSYFFDRISHTFALPSLADLLEQRAASMDLGFSWQQAP